jgi:Protein of unknown function (DUF1638)
MATSNSIIACGALGPSIRSIVERRGWQVDIHLMPSLLHNRPKEIAPKVEQLAARLQGEGRDVAVAYADCGTYGALDDVCQRLGMRHLAGLHCYDVFAGAEAMTKIFSDEPGTYVLTDFLVRSFRRTVLAELGLDEHPELWDDYFAHYRRLVWLAQDRSDALEAEARAIATMFEVPLEIHVVANGSLESELEAM